MKVVTKQIKFTGFIEISLPDSSTEEDFLEEAQRVLGPELMVRLKSKTIEIEE